MAKARNNYTEDRAWSDQYVSACIRLCGYLYADKLFAVSPPDDDMKRCSDLTWIRTIEQNGKSIGLRVRKPDVWEKYKYDFTLRSRRANGAKTEFEKIVTDGYGEIMVYAHADAIQQGKLAHHWVIDLNVFRTFITTGIIKITREKANGDGTYFLPFDVRLMPQGTVVSGSDAALCEDRIQVTPKPRKLFVPGKMVAGIPYTGMLF